MPLHLSATPATITKRDGYEMVETDVFDSRIIRTSHQPTTLKDAESLYAAFVAGLPAGTWSVIGYWNGRDRAPRGFKAAAERRAFQSTPTVPAPAIAA